jgi:hypothetical protein
MDFKDQVTFAFNKFFYDLVKDVKGASTDLKTVVKKHYKVKNSTTSSNIEHFSKQLTDELYQKVVSIKTEELFGDQAIRDLGILQHIKLGSILDSTPKEYHATVCSYLYIFVLMATLHKQEDEEVGKALFIAVMNAVRAMQKGEDFEGALVDVYDDDIKLLVQNTSKVIKSQPLVDDDTPDFIPSMLENSKIGSLAKEITSEIDIGSLEIKDTSDIMSLMNSNVIGDIMSKVGSKINSKIEKGELNHEDLLGEAMNFMKMLQKNGGGDNPLMNMMGDLMKNKQGGKVRVDESKVRSLSTRDRLKKRHEEKYGNA